MLVPTVADELKSLRIEREERPSRLPGWATAAIAGVVVMAILAVAWKVLAPRIFVPEVETTAVSLVSPAQAQQLLVATGYVVPQRQANISPRIGGRVAKLFVEDGTVVKKGQLLAVLEDADFKAQVLQAKADVAAAKAREKRAEADLFEAQHAYDREKMVQSKGVSTPAALDQVTARLAGAKAQLDAARSETEAANARVEVARVNLENCYVRAPFDGRITQKLTDIGEIVFGALSAGTGGRGGIASLADFSTLQVEADVSESQVAKLAPGTPAEIVLDAFPDRRYRGRVAEVRPRVDRAKATVTVKVAFVDEPRDVLPDMGAKVTFLTKELDAAQAKAAPVAAVQSDAVVEQGENKVVWVVGGNDEVRIAPVVTGVAMGGLVALREGPPAGTKVVRRPNGDLRPGMRVKEK
ncbi:MAG: efflux RND transporter periplasmic adaptor subunit, partial [Myxococcales bacterium]